MRLSPPCLAALLALLPAAALASTVPDSLSLGSLVGVFPTGTASPFASFSSTSFNSANTPYGSGQVGMMVSFDAAVPTQAATVVASGADGSNLTGYDNTPATVTLAASGNALVSASAVPEPAALALVPVGMLALLVARRRRA